MDILRFMKIIFSIILFLLVEVIPLSAEQVRSEVSIEQAREIVSGKLKGFDGADEVVKMLSTIVNDESQPIQVRLAAIRSLGDNPTKESISVLVDNISLRSKDSFVTQAMISLRKIGMGAMPVTLQALEKAAQSKSSEQRQSDLVQAIVEISGGNLAFPKWYYANEKQLNEDVKLAITRYAISW